MSKQTIPRLELLSSLLASRLTESIKSALEDVKKLDSVTYWSGSTGVLCWFRSPNKEFKQIVENRLVEIRRLAPPELWKYVPTKQNPADIASCGTTATQLTENKLWWNGPEFLIKSTEHWPCEPYKDHQEDYSKLKSPAGNITTSAVDVAQVPSIVELIGATRYSSMARLFRVTAYVSRFVDNLKKRVEKLDATIGSLSSEKMDNALNADQKWIKDMQFPMSLQAN